MKTWHNMRMRNKKQLWLAIGGFILIQIFYFGFDTVQLNKEGTVGADGEVTAEHAWDDHLDEALASLNEEDRTMVETLMDQADQNEVVTLKQLASFWVSRSEWELGGHYLEVIAGLSSTAEDIVSAARTYATGAQQEKDASHRTIFRRKALSLYDQVIAMENDPFQVELEKVLFMIKVPDDENPMLGVLSLVELSKNYPQEPEVFVHLGKFSIQTGQWDKARERLEQAYELNPESKETICLLSTVYKEVGESEQSARFSQLCENK